MARVCRIAILSDIHYACAAEQARGDDYEYRDVSNPLVRLAYRAYRTSIWLRHPLRQSHLLDQFITRVGAPDYVIANGDYSCNSGFVGVSDDAACQSARECLEKLRSRFAPNFQAVFGDHELGKVSLLGGRGGMRLASWHRACRDLTLQPLWSVELGRYVLMGITSSLVALPVYEPDTLEAELPEWRRLREQHLSDIRGKFNALQAGQRVLLFCHDPTALPFLWREEAVRNRLPQIEQTVIGHLHTNLVLRKSRMLAGMPRISFLGHTARRMTTALNEARRWRPFRVRLCPSLAGVELLKDGGFCTADLDLSGDRPAHFQFHPIKR
jgi:hypothetical protein